MYKHAHALDMRRLREQIDRLHARYAIAACHEQFKIARQRRRLAGNIHDSRGRKPQQLLECPRVTAAPGRIEHRRVECAIKLPKRLLDPTDLEAHICDPVLLRRYAAILNRAGVFFDP